MSVNLTGRCTICLRFLDDGVCPVCEPMPRAINYCHLCHRPLFEAKKCPDCDNGRSVSSRRLRCTGCGSDGALYAVDNTLLCEECRITRADSHKATIDYWKLLKAEMDANEKGKSKMARVVSYSKRAGGGIEVVPGTGTYPDTPLQTLLETRLIGQPQALAAICPIVNAYRVGLLEPTRPAGVFLLLGPTGSGKTHTVQALAECIHGASKNVLRVDCGEYQMEHEVAKLIGAPPGYLGHRETPALLQQAKLNSMTTDRSNISILLFDEIEKGSAALARLLLGILDTGTLRLGDNTLTQFSNTLIFLTSNLGSSEMSAEARGYGLAGHQYEALAVERVLKLGTAAAKRRFSPEFINRLDQIVAYTPLTDADLGLILDIQLRELGERLTKTAAYDLHVSEESKKWLLRRGCSPEYGARELRRTLQRDLTWPLSAWLLENKQVLAETLPLHVALKSDKLVFSVWKSATR